MENTETTPVQTEETTPVVPSVVVETPQTTNDITPVIVDEQTTPIVSGEQTTTTTTETETVPEINGETTTTTTTEEPSVTEKETEVVPPTDEQENVTETNTVVPPTSLSPGRVNVPLKEVNESEEPALIPNGTENGVSKKRELEQEDEPTEETTNDNDERTGVDQTKKIKISDPTDTPIVETIEPENNIIVNGTATAIEA